MPLDGVPAAGAANQLKPLDPAPPPGPREQSFDALLRGDVTLPKEKLPAGASVTQRTQTGASSGQLGGNKFETTGTSRSVTGTVPLGNGASLGFDRREGENNTRRTAPNGRVTNTTTEIQDTGVSLRQNLTQKGANPSVSAEIRYGEAVNAAGKPVPSIRGQVTTTGKVPLGRDVDLTGAVQIRGTTNLETGQTTGRVNGSVGLPIRAGDVTVTPSASVRAEKNFQTGQESVGASIGGTIGVQLNKQESVGIFGGFNQGGVNRDPSDGLAPVTAPVGGPSGGSTTFGIFYQNNP